MELLFMPVTSYPESLKLLTELLIKLLELRNGYTFIAANVEAFVKAWQ